MTISVDGMNHCDLHVYVLNIEVSHPPALRNPQRWLQAFATSTATATAMDLAASSAFTVLSPVTVATTAPQVARSHAGPATGATGGELSHGDSSALGEVSNLEFPIEFPIEFPKMVV